MKYYQKSISDSTSFNLREKKWYCMALSFCRSIYIWVCY